RAGDREAGLEAALGEALDAVAAQVEAHLGHARAEQGLGIYRRAGAAERVGVEDVRASADELSAVHERGEVPRVAGGGAVAHVEVEDVAGAVGGGGLGVDLD